MREKSLSLGQRYWRDWSTGQGGGSSGARRQKTKANFSSSGSCSSLLDSPCVFLFFVPKRVCLRFGGLSSGSHETQKPISS
jgi:hypothetical protein